MRPVELVRRAEEHVGAGGDVDRAVRRVVHGVDPGERAGLVRELEAISATGVTVPTPFEAHGKATTRVRSESSERR